MSFVNYITTAVFDVLMAPFEALPPLLVLIIWSVVTGIVMAVVFRCTSNQKALAEVANETSANILAIKLFQDDLGVTFRCLLKLLHNIAQRLRHSFRPMLIMLVPMVLLLVQLALRFEYEPLQIGESAVVELRLAPAVWEQFNTVRIEAPDTVRVETPAMRDSRLHTVYWRLSAMTAEPVEVRWTFGDRTIEKGIAVADSSARLLRVDTVRPGANWLEQLLHPGEQSLDNDLPVRDIVVHHVRRVTPILNCNVPWWATFLIVSCLTAWLVRPIVKVQY